ncbi:hypothetical protein JMM81_12995 [Bacillus sp. V3B]|uniref:DUF6944 family repetitive protein n=1 Tax=Bacillus sp. V3B TaxID=2804915 RepID=UPI0021090236|nr:hypothetical protein [Bacillus sp. V3B]MCQ6275868.1 hypothetical protein [Bacillus sp. V3B]
MDNQTKKPYDAWIQAVGTIISAIGSTPSNRIKKELQNDLNLWGNVLQGTGNALSADGEAGESLEKVGNQIQAIGNSSVVAGIMIEFNEETGQKFIITGNWLQALGGVTALGEELQGPSSPSQSYNIIGNLLQSIGNSLQAIAGIYELEKSAQNIKSPKGQRNSLSLEVNGSWIQAVGSVISLIGQTKE